MGASDPASAHAFTAQHIADLYQLGRIGHVRGIQAKLAEIERENPTNAPLAAQLREMVARFELKRYMSALQDVRSHEQARQVSSNRRDG